uniref:Secreted protein n=1 Tax=Molossus molossus TaxID=27622 RepID=A0A7J8ERJ9_MOLMO|nr:hypothetical protein HJG59_008718 [Molossus molossus]
MVTDRRGFLFLLFIFKIFILFGDRGAEGFLSMTCMKLNRKLSKPNPPIPLQLYDYPKQQRRRRKEKSGSPLFSLQALYFYTHWSLMGRAFGRNLCISGGGGGVGTDCFPFLYTRSRGEVPKGQLVSHWSY